MSSNGKSKGKDKSNNDLANNPFAALFPSMRHAQDYIEATRSALGDSNRSVVDQEKHESVEEVSNSVCNIVDEQCKAPQVICEVEQKARIINDMLQRIFYITVNPGNTDAGLLKYGDVPSTCIFLRDMYKELKDGNERLLLTGDNLSQSLMERLSLSQPESYITASPTGKQSSLTTSLSASEPLLIKYLALCYTRLREEKRKLLRLLQVKEVIEEVRAVLNSAKSLVLSFAGSVLLSPDIFPTNNPHLQLFNLFISYQDVDAAPEFLNGLARCQSDIDDVRAIFDPTLDCYMDRLKHLKLIDPEVYAALQMITFFTKDSKLAKVLVDNKHWFPPNLREAHFCSVQGIAFEHATLLGLLLGLTPISYIPSVASEHFHEPSRQSQGEMEAITANLRERLDFINTKVHEILHSLLQYSELKHFILYWIGDCLHRNSVRAQLYCEMDFSRSLTHSRDGFFLNLSHVLLKFSEPFSNPKSKLLLRVDPSYCLVRKTPRDIANPSTKVHLVGLADETMLAALDENASHVEPDEQKFKFVTECFFLTHQCIKVGLVKAFNNYHNLMKRLQKLSDLYHEAKAQQSPESVIEPLRRDFEQRIQEQLSIKAHLLNPSLTRLCLKFCIGSCYWLTQLALADKDFGDEKHRDIPHNVSVDMESTPLTHTPEFVVENIADCLIWLGFRGMSAGYEHKYNYSPWNLEKGVEYFDEEAFEIYSDQLSYVMEFFSLFLGSSARLKNPHLRAKLAEALGAFLRKRQDSQGLAFTSVNLKEMAFESSPVAPALLPRALLNLFVDIEFTGHSMEFEQKFGYRHHMYAVLEHVWKIKSYYKTFYALYEEGRHELQQNMQFSVFPRFINLLVNDATFLLDEALQYLVKIRELEKDREDWKQLPAAQRQEKEHKLSQYGSFARGYNIMANETVHALCYVTTDITRPFASPCMVDRMAAFLNYFLLHLVGPKRRGLKVNDFEKYNFQPAELVSNITKILINLGKEEDFCRAVPRDGRSYSADLYDSAVGVLRQINRDPSFVEEFAELGRKFAEYAKELEKEEDDLSEAPEEFIDPILGTLMYEPVRLPSSGKIVDRATISRHLLSDPKDPFNRCPLSLDMVIPERELQQRIEKWIEENNLKRRVYSSSDCSG